MGRITDRIIRESKFVDFEKLCIKEGEKVWAVFVDIYTINDDGNLLDAAGIGAIAALKNARIPKYDEKTEKVLYGELSEEKLPFSKDTPLSITIHKVGDNLIVDPTREEEDVGETRVTIGGSNGTISSMQKGNKESLTIEKMNEILDLSEKVLGDIFKKIEKFLK